MGVRGYVTIAFFAYFLFLLAGLPAQKVVDWGIPKTNELSFSAVEGTVWNGHADRLLVEKRPVEALAWRFRPQALLFGEIAFNFAFGKSDSWAGGGRIGWGPLHWDTFFLEGVQGRVTLDQLRGLIPDLPEGILARIQWQLERVLLSQTQLVFLNGAVMLHDLTMVTPMKLFLGDFKIQAQTVDHKLMAQIQDVSFEGKNDTILAVRLEFKMDEQGRYNLNGEITPRDKNDEHKLSNILKNIGKPIANGGVRVNLNGKWPGWKGI
ncbi:MAG: type II secretion system protein N [Magnetococcus sp. DMHC-6]